MHPHIPAQYTPTQAQADVQKSLAKEQAEDETNLAKLAEKIADPKRIKRLAKVRAEAISVS